MPYRQSGNPLSRKTSPLRRSPFKNTDPALQHENSISDDEHFRLSSNTDEHSVMIDGSTYDPEFDAATNTKEKVSEYYKKNPKPEDIVKNVTSSILTPASQSMGIADGLDQLRPTTAAVKPNVDMDSKLVNKALSSIDASKNKDLSVDDRNIAERRARRQIARAQRKEIRKTQPKGKERREAIKKTRENQGRKEENMVSE